MSLRVSYLAFFVAYLFIATVALFGGTVVERSASEATALARSSMTPVAR